MGYTESPGHRSGPSCSPSHLGASALGTQQPGPHQLLQRHGPLRVQDARTAVPVPRGGDVKRQRKTRGCGGAARGGAGVRLGPPCAPPRARRPRPPLMCAVLCAGLPLLRPSPRAVPSPRPGSARATQPRAAAAAVASARPDAEQVAGGGRGQRPGGARRRPPVAGGGRASERASERTDGPGTLLLLLLLPPRRTRRPRAPAPRPAPRRPARAAPAARSQGPGRAAVAAAAQAA